MFVLQLIISRDFLYHIRQADNSGVRIWHKSSWRDKAGGYGIQEPFGRQAVKSIEGDFNNVVGLPLNRLRQILKDDFDYDV